MTASKKGLEPSLLTHSSSILLYPSLDGMVVETQQLGENSCLISFNSLLFEMVVETIVIN
jgi:hypothetical protein